MIMSGVKIRSFARFGVLPAALLAGLALPAFADASFPTSYASAVTSSLPPPGIFTIGSSTGDLNAIDGVKSGYSFFIGAGQNITVQYTISFVGSTIALGGDLHVFIYDWQTASASSSTVLTAIRWEHGANSATWSGLSLNLGAGGTPGDTKQVYGANDLSNYTAFAGTFDRNLANTLVLTFAVVTAGNGDNFTFDAVSNPEPGTMALFGLGVMGLGGLVLRRRRAIKAQKSA